MPTASQMEVFVVDDTSTSRALLCGALDELRIHNYRVARDGQDALQQLMVRPAPIVLSDMAMPKMNGLELLQALRQFKPTSRVGFVLVTGLADKTVIEQARRYGLNNILMKPFKSQDLRVCLEAVVGKIA